ncbi:electron transfer flavoprotein subunit alpha/FixB family protein [Yinghuangia sp. YIM S10712]|uniref:electron transfer flavoprotein subunit alpha/FixB family protein n=1 Tax=Yinghuangia sp. YIM S10712 TaxID=3436930 RepID=UPI003F5368EA
MGPVLVLVEQHEGNGDTVQSRTYELLTIARRFGDPVAVARHPVDAACVAALGRYGATRVCVVESAVPGASPAVVAVAGLAELAWQMSAVAVLIGSGREGREVAARTSVRLGAGIVTDAVDVRPGPGGPVTVQDVCEGAYRVESVVRGDSPVITVAPGAVAAVPDPAVPVVERVRVRPAEPACAVRVVARTPKTRRPGVAGAAVVVAGGRGVGSADGFALIEKVADALGGAVGGTHAAADHGWCPPDALIGQTGAIVHPRLYLACGISGSVHHRAGMRHASTIVAIDKDPSAPIFRIADVAVVGDLHEVLPALLAELDRRRRQPCGVEETAAADTAVT